MVLLCHSSECGLFSVPSLFCLLGLLPRYNRQGRKVLDLREQVQHENAKSAQYRDQQLPYCTQREQQCDQQLLCVSPHRVPQLLATPDGPLPLPRGWHNLDTQTLDT